MVGFDYSHIFPSLITILNFASSLFGVSCQHDGLAGVVWFHLISLDFIWLRLVVTFVVVLSIGF